MSAAELARVNALEQQTYALKRKGHYARAAEKLGAAVRAAQALRIPDCLITAWLQAYQASFWVLHADVPGMANADGAYSALVQRTLNLTLGCAIPTLQRRRAAGTLLPGACQPLEEAWYAARLRDFAQLRFPEDAVLHSAAAHRVQARHLGYEAYLKAATIALHNASMLARVGEHDLVRRLVEFVVDAAELMVQPRSDPTLMLLAELAFADALGKIEHARVLASDAPRRQQVLDAWRRVQRSGVLRERGFEGIHGEAQRRQEIRRAAFAAQNAAAVQHACALPACGAREVHEAQFKKCAACQAVVYCCKEHQAAHWPAHKVACKAARKAAAQGGAGPSSGV